MNDPPKPTFYTPEKETQKHRRSLPHWNQAETWCFVTWRLGDSIPESRFKEWVENKKYWMECHPKPWDDATDEEFHERFSRQLDDWLDQGAGSCLLKDAENARIVANALLFFNGGRYELATFAVMPNHVHVLFCPRQGHGIKDILHSWKSFTANEINKRTGSRGTLWQEEYWDRLIRNENHFYKCAEYVRNNPAKAGLKTGFVVWDKNGARASSPCQHLTTDGLEARPPFSS